MRLKIIGCTIIMASMLMSQASFAAPTALTYKNQRGSILELSILGDHKLEGFFTTMVASKSCQQAIRKKAPVVGYIVGNALSISVAYPNCGSVLSVIGNFDKKHSMIDTMAILNQQSTDVTHEGPGARFIAHDTYKKIH